MQQEKVLSFLINNKGSHISGQAIAGELGVTRAAIWKAVEALREVGYEIESLPARGYRLAGVPDLLTSREISLGLDTRTLGRRIYSLKEVDSTNTFAVRLAADGEPEGSIVVAEVQTAGRGRLGRKWVAPPNVNILMSLILRPEIPPQDAPMATLVAGVAVAGALNRHYGLGAGIKWPNDVLVDGKKVAGILTEMSAEPERVRHIVVGIGINVNMPAQAFPRDIRDASTSVMAILGRKVNRAEMLRHILAEFEGCYEALKSTDRRSILERWRGLSCTLGRTVKVSTFAGSMTGTAVDIDEDGRLIVESEDGVRRTVTAGDVSVI